ncbi:MAG: hypothetical protein CEE38_23740 [Planctomycetes bacterium B3_Pla]|nr:MAG: hypothetical protein CEE38_23740 [Planctomycetes bacterium B3_Pla]
MKKFSTTLMLLFLVVGLAASQVFGQDAEEETDVFSGVKIAQTGMKFLSFSVDARSAAMSDAITGEDNGSAVSMFYNPSSMARLDKNLSMDLGQTKWIADINYNMGSVAFRPAGGALGVFGLTFMSVDYGELQGTIRADTKLGYEDTEMFNPTAMVAGIGYAKALSDRFAIGVGAKFVKEDLGRAIVDYDTTGAEVYDATVGSTIAYDFGLIYRTGFKSLTFAMTARNFSKDNRCTRI